MGFLLLYEHVIELWFTLSRIHNCRRRHNPKQIIILLNAIDPLQSISISAFGLAFQFDFHLTVYLAFVLSTSSPGGNTSRGLFRFDFGQALWPLYCLTAYKVMFSRILLWFPTRSQFQRFPIAITFWFSCFSILVEIISGSFTLWFGWVAQRFASVTLLFISALEFVFLICIFNYFCFWSLPLRNRLVELFRSIILYHRFLTTLGGRCYDVSLRIH